jgi:hypothetical protein
LRRLLEEGERTYGIGGVPLESAEQIAEQRRLETVYLDERSPAEAERMALFGEDYRTVPPRMPFVASTTAFLVFCAVLPSVVRTPTINAIATALAPRTPESPQQGEFANRFDPATVGAVVGALAVWYVGCIAVPAMNHAAFTMRNLPQRRRVPTRVLYPDPTASVEVVLGRARNGTLTKYFYKRPSAASAPAYRPGVPWDAATQEALDMVATGARRAAEHAQSIREGGDEARFIQPALSSFANWVRRVATTSQRLLDPGSLFLESTLASGSAAAMTSLLLETLKVCDRMRLPGTKSHLSLNTGLREVDDLVGGKTSLPMFTWTRAEPQLPAGTLRDLLSISYLADSTRLSGHILREVLWLRPRELWHGPNPTHASGTAWDLFMTSPLADLLVRHVMIIIDAATSARGWGSFWSQLLRPGATLDPAPGEPLQSSAQQLQQSSQSFKNDFSWQARDLFPRLKFDYAGAVRARNKLAVGEAVATMARAAWRLADRLESLHEHSPDAPRSSGSAVDAQATMTAGEPLEPQERSADHAAGNEAGSFALEMDDRLRLAWDIGLDQVAAAPALDDEALQLAAQLREDLRSPWETAHRGPALSLEAIRGVMTRLQERHPSLYGRLHPEAEALFEAAVQLERRLREREWLIQPRRPGNAADAASQAEAANPRDGVRPARAATGAT